MAEMTMIEALEILASYNETGFETLVKTNASEPMTIEYAIEEVRNYAEDPDEIFVYMLPKIRFKNLMRTGISNQVSHFTE
jgi:hypothetical protein